MRSFAVHALFFTFFASFLLVHAALPGNGTYTIQNLDTKTYVNLKFNYYASPQEGTPIVGSKANPYANPYYNSLNNKWILARKGDVFFTLRNNYNGTYLEFPDERTAGKAVGNKTPGIFKISETRDNVYHLNTSDDKYSLYLPSNADGTPLVLAHYDPSNDKQLWTFERV